MNRSTPSRSALVLAHRGEHRARQWHAGPGLERLAEVENVASGRRELPGQQQGVSAARSRDRYQPGDGAAAIGDLDRISPLDLAEVAARGLAQLANPYGSHVLLIAHHGFSATPM